MPKTKRILTWVLMTGLLISVLVFAVGCDLEQFLPSLTEPTVATKPTEGETEPPETEAYDPELTLEDLRQEMKDTASGFAVAYIGDNYLDEKDLPALIQELSPSICEKMPFILEIPEKNIVDLGWGEIYCIIPASAEATVRVYQAVEISVEEWESTVEYTDLVYESDAGEPFLLVCTPWGEMPTVRVTVTNGNEEVDWIPRHDKYRRLEPLSNERGESLFWDLTSYLDRFTQYYLNNLDGYRLPTREDLEGKAWGWEGVALYDTLYTTYLLAFEEDGIAIRWNDGIDREDHELRNIPWELNYVDGFAVLTMDLGEFAGIRSYNLLYDEVYGWLFTMTDLSDGAVTVGEEIPFRHTEPRSLNAPDPIQMVGNWVRTRTEFEGNVETDETGRCTIQISGGSVDNLVLSYTNRDASDQSYRNRSLEIAQGSIYYGCGNDLWRAEVDYVGPYGMTYSITLLEDGTLLLQNYWLMDGAPSVSYEWFRRVS